MNKTVFEPICLSFTDGEMTNRLQAIGIRCYVIETSNPFNISIQQRIIKLIRKEHIVIIHAHGTRAASNVLFPSILLELPLIYTVQGWSFHDDQGKLIYTLRKWSEKLICHFAKQVICVSDGNAETGKKQFNLSNPIVIKNGVNLRRFNPEKHSTLNRGDLGFNDNDFIVGFIARCTKQKAPIDFLDAVERAHQHDNRVKGLFIGEGDMDVEVNKFITEHHMEDYLFRSPFRIDIPDILSLLDIYCLPSLWKGLSIGLLEAMATGCAIIATPTDGTQEVIIHEQNGMIIPFNSPESICSTIIRFMNDDSLRSKCQTNVVSLISKQFNAQHTADCTVDIYKRLSHTRLMHS
nr:glycosyltransferase [uncultured Prevotella sp.]